MELYYDDERIATLMRDWFDVQFIDNMDFETMQRPTKWHIAETSHAIFKPQVGDLVKMTFTGGDRISYRPVTGKKDGYYEVGGFDDKYGYPNFIGQRKIYEIIQRNGKPFFTPLREE